MLRTLRAKYGVQILYAGADEKRQFSEQLAAVGGLPPDIVDSALFDTERVNYTPGANRNAALLHSVGQAAFSADDDTLCRVATAPDFSEQIRIATDCAPEDFWFFPDRKAALESASLSERDILAIHEKWLGQKVSGLVSPSSANGSKTSNPAEARLLERMTRSAGRVRLTFNGLAGDCGWGSPFGFWGRPLGYLLLSGRSRDRLLRTERDYRQALTSREVLRVVAAPTVSDQACSTSTFFGFDNHDLLPPFLPVARGQDLLFGTVLSLCFQDAYVGHLPHALLHVPREQRVFNPGELLRSASGYDTAKLIFDCISLFSRDLRATAPAQNLQTLGNSLAGLAAEKPKGFACVVRDRARQTADAAVQTMQEFLSIHNNAPVFWAEDMKKYATLLHRHAHSDDYAVPLDLLDAGRNREQALTLAQRLVGKFGDLLRFWPDIVRAAAALRERGCTLAVPVQE
jgi:hypothetical protein